VVHGQSSGSTARRRGWSLGASELRAQFARRAAATSPSVARSVVDPERLWKAECGPNEGVVGVAQGPLDLSIDAVLCSPTRNVAEPTYCHAVTSPYKVRWPNGVFG
jgi:hypothetical protein